MVQCNPLLRVAALVLFTSCTRALPPAILPQENEPPPAELELEATPRRSFNEAELILIQNVAFFESGWIERAEQCEGIAGTVLGRWLHPNHRRYGRTLWEVTRPDQFHVVRDFSLCLDQTCTTLRSIRSGLAVPETAAYLHHPSGKSQTVKELVTAQYALCAAAVRGRLADPRGSVFLDFRADGSGGTVFDVPFDLPDELPTLAEPQRELEDVLREHLGDSSADEAESPGGE
ncbi:MAG: hypothetical protein A2284_09780 [Deltaproteobacteria bacterium RIFOXYA12_FULL_61_11]|nr:MAG: hypothetical protein A2284_09780 [Deltaproteobacteria bacterium RIFOXYA12_FULL_61_11]